VIALSLIRRQFAKKAPEWIRCKFSIDAASPSTILPVVHHFETIRRFRKETSDSPSAANALRAASEKSSDYTVFCPDPARLSVRLMSL
jgi:hypothetical protein